MVAYSCKLYIRILKQIIIHYPFIVIHSSGSSTSTSTLNSSIQISILSIEKMKKKNYSQQLTNVERVSYARLYKAFSLYDKHVTCYVIHGSCSYQVVV